MSTKASRYLHVGCSTMHDVGSELVSSNVASVDFSGAVP